MRQTAAMIAIVMGTPFLTRDRYPAAGARILRLCALYVKPVEGTRLDQLGEYEQRFRHAGLPLFIADRSAATDVFNRAVPLLGLVFLGEMLGALNLEWSPLGNVAAVAGGLLILLVAIALTNKARGRPAVGIPQDVGKVELALFVIVPALLPLVFNGQWRSALATAAGNLILLALIYGVVGFGLTSILRWTAGRLAGQLRASLELFARAIPLLMIFSVVLFLTTEMWQVFTEIPFASMMILLGLFVALGTTFLMARLPIEVRAIERDAAADAPALLTSERVNVGMVMFVSQALQVLFVSLAVGGFFVAVGMLAVDAAVMESWIGTSGEVLWDPELFGEVPLLLTTELLEVAGAIAAFTGLYFAISMLTDDVYRREFLEELTSEMRESFRARAEYLRLRSSA